MGRQDALRRMRAATTMKSMGPVTLATFEDTCGNLIYLAQPESCATEPHDEGRTGETSWHKSLHWLLSF